MPDVEGVAHVCGEAFGLGNFPGVINPELDALEERYMQSIAKGVREKLQSTLERKRQATLLHREQRLRRTASQLQEVLRGRRLPQKLSLEEKRNERKWLRQRMFACLVAQCEETGEIVGTVSMSMMQPEALLPAPFPSTVPYRAYLYNMGVLSRHRRKGVAKALLQACMRTARLWGADSLWLHVRTTRTKALALYKQQGFRLAQAPSPLPTAKALMGEVLLKVDLEPLRRSSYAAAAAAGVQREQFGPSQPGGVNDDSTGEEPVVAGSTRQDGVFIWDVAVTDGGAASELSPEEERRQLTHAPK